MNKQLFPTGQIVATQGVLANHNQAQLWPYITRHISGDWGNVSENDAKENSYSVSRDLRILSSYNMEDGTKIWIITEADRSATTVLLPDEY